MTKIKHNTVTLRTTNPEDNITDLAHVLAVVAFQAGLTEDDILACFEQVVGDQFFQCILSLTVD